MFRVVSRFSTYISGLAVAFGVMVLTGWALHIQRLKGIIPGQVAVKANAAACFVLIGLALWLAISGVRRRFVSVLATLLALLASLVGLLSFLEWLRGWDLGFDQLLFTAGPDDLPGSVRLALMSPIAAADFFLLGLTVAMLKINGRWWRILKNVLPTSAAVAAMFGILDFVLDPQHTHTHIAPLTALILFLFSFGVLSAPGKDGFDSLLLSKTAGGMLCRRLLPAAIVIPIAIAWLRWRGQQAGLYSDWTGLSIMTVTCGVLLAGLTVWTAFVVDRADAEKGKAEASARSLAAIDTSSNDAIIGKTLDGIVTSWNPGAEAIYGYSAAEMIGQSLARTVSPEGFEEFQETLQRLRRGETVRSETERIRKDGKQISVSISVSPVKDEKGAILGVSAITRDITEQKQAEQKLQEASRYSRNLLEASLDPLVTISKEGKITDVNHATERATGLSRDLLIGSDFCDYFTEPEKARDGYARVFDEGLVRDYPLAIRNASGAVMDVLYNATVFRAANGEVEGVFAAARDITESKQAEEALHRSEARYRSLVTATAQIVWTTDRNGQVVDDMPMWREYTGMSRQQIAGAGWLNSLHPDDRNRTEQVWAKAWGNRERYNTEYRIRRADGEYRIFAVRGVPVLEDDATVREWVGTCTDITERKLAEEQVRLLNEELERRVKERTAELESANKELEAFTYSVSHDLRAPLRHISGFSKVLSEDYSATLPPNAQHHLERIVEGTRRMGQLVDDLLNLGRVGRKELSLQVVGLRSIVGDVIQSLRSDVGERKVEWKIGELPYVECDTALVVQVFQNLLSNALKFTRPRAAAVIEIGQESHNGLPAVFVRDNGVGFSMKYSDKLFGVFQRLHRDEDFEGTGVGLATVQRIIQKHGGRIWAEAELDKGATFHFTLAASELSKGQSGDAKQACPSARPEQVRQLTQSHSGKDSEVCKA